jgi:hypothetical protein
MTRAFITGSFAEKYRTNTVHCQKNKKTRKYKYLRTGNSYQLQISLLVVWPLELIFNTSFRQKIKKSSLGLNGMFISLNHYSERVFFVLLRLKMDAQMRKILYHLFRLL